MTIKQALILATNKLNKPSPSPSLDAEVLLCFVLKKSKEFLHTHPESKLTAAQLKKFSDYIKRRAKNEPIAYIIKTKEFYGLDFYVDKRVLIPRPETELLVDTILSLQTPYSDKCIIADIGTGSGCIAVTLAKQLPKAEIMATDISKKTLLVAKKNAKKHKVKIKFYHGDLIAPLKNKKINIIAANLPYLDNYYKTSTNPGLKYEPKTALEGFQHGIAVYEKLFRQIDNRKQKPKFIICEIGYNQAKKMEKLIKKYLPKSGIIIKKDLAGLNRLAIINN